MMHDITADHQSAASTHPTDDHHDADGFGPDVATSTSEEGDTIMPFVDNASSASTDELPVEAVRAAAEAACLNGLSDQHFAYLTGEGVDPAFLRRLVRQYSLFSGECMGRTGIFFIWHDGMFDTDPFPQFRPDVPGTFSNGDPFLKYLVDKGVSMSLWCLKHGAPGGPVLVQEGTKQAMVAASYAPADTWVFAIAGCGNWNVRSLQALDAEGRDITVILDADYATNWNVHNQAVQLKEHLGNYPGATVRFAKLTKFDGNESAGLDDYLKQFPADKRGTMLAGLTANASERLPREPKRTAPKREVPATAFPASLLALVPSGGEGYTLPAGAEMVPDQGVLIERGQYCARATFAPVVITRTFRDHLNVSSVELAWMVRGKAVVATVPRGMLASGRALIETLGDRGFPAVTSDAGALETFLVGMLAANEDRIADEYLARWLGWQPDGSFVATADDGVMVEMPEAKMQSRVPAYTTGGTFGGWQAAVRGVESRPVPRIFLAASLAANLLKPLGFTSFTVALDGRSSGGKTISAIGAASAWHDPSESSAAHMNWDTTQMGIELRMGVAHGMATWIDETQLVPERQAGKVGETVYSLPDDHGRSRGGAWMSNVPWSGILLATGEKDLLSFVKGQGAAARVVQMHGRPFGDDGQASAAQADAYSEACRANFGHAGPRFAEQLSIRLACDPAARQSLRDRAAELAQVFKSDNDIANRRANRIGILMLAEELACDWGILPYSPLSAAQWLSAINTAEATDDRPQMAMEALVRFLASNPGRVSKTNGRDVDKPHSGWVAFEKRDRVAAREFLAVDPDHLTKILADAGYDLAQVEAEWLDRKWLRTMDSADGRPKVRVGKTTVRMVCVWSNVIEGDGEDDGTEARDGFDTAHTRTEAQPEPDPGNPWAAPELPTETAHTEAVIPAQQTAEQPAGESVPCDVCRQPVTAPGFTVHAPGTCPPKPDDPFAAGLGGLDYQV